MVGGMVEVSIANPSDPDVAEVPCDDSSDWYGRTDVAAYSAGGR